MKRILTLIYALLTCSTVCGMNDEATKEIAAQAVKKASLICEAEITEEENSHHIIRESPAEPEMVLAIVTYVSRGHITRAWKGCRVGDRIEIRGGSTKWIPRERLTDGQTRTPQEICFIISYEHEVDNTGAIITQRD